MAEGEQSWSDIIKIYNNPGAFVVSGTLFILYMILTLIDINDTIKSYNILDIDNTTRGTMVYAYLSGYFMFVLKLIIAILTIFVLVTIIRISIIVVFSVLKNLTFQSGGRKYYQLGGEGEAEDLIKTAVTSNFRLFFGFFTVPDLAYFIVLYLVIIPLVFLFFLYTIVKFYDQNQIEKENKNEAANILNTNHHYILFVMSTLISMGVIYVLITYYFELLGPEVTTL